MNSGGADYKITVPEVFGVMPDGHGNLHGTEMADGIALCHVRALDLEAHAVQHLRKRAHGHAADAHQMGPLAGENVVADGTRIVHHQKDSLLRLARRSALQKSGKYLIILPGNSFF